MNNNAQKAIPDKEKLLYLYEQLNSTGKMKVANYILDIASIDFYKKLVAFDKLSMKDWAAQK